MHGLLDYLLPYKAGSHLIVQFVHYLSEGLVKDILYDTGDHIKGIHVLGLCFKLFWGMRGGYFVLATDRLLEVQCIFEQSIWVVPDLAVVLGHCKGRCHTAIRSSAEDRIKLLNVIKAG